MTALRYQTKFAALSALFVGAGIASLVWQLPWLMVVPFAVVGFPLVVHIAVHKTWWLYVALLIALPLSTEVNISPTLGFDFPDEPLMLLLTGLLLLTITHKPSQFPKAVLHHPLFLLITVHLIWIVTTCFFSQNGWLSVKFVLAKVWYIVPFVVLAPVFLTTKKSIKTVALCFLIPMLFVVVQSLIRHALVGFSFSGVKDTFSPFFRNHVTYSAMLVCLLAVGWGVYILTPFTKASKKWLALGLSVGLAGLVFAYSRGAWLALIIGLVTIVAIKQKLMGWLLAIAVAGIIITSGWLVYQQNYLRFAPDYNTTIFHSDIADHLQATVTLKDVSNAERFYRWIAAANMAEAKPITGFGPNTFYPYYKLYTQTPFKTWVSNNPDHSTVHNYFLLVLVEQGFPGLIIFCSVYFAALLYSQRLYHRLTDPFYKTVALVIGVILAMIGSLIFMNDLVETDKTGSLFWLCMGMLMVVGEQAKTTTRTL